MIVDVKDDPIVQANCVMCGKDSIFLAKVS